MEQCGLLVQVIDINLHADGCQLIKGMALESYFMLLDQAVL